MEKLHEYQGLTGRLHEMKDNIRDRVESFKESKPENVIELAKQSASDQLKGNVSADKDYSHLYRHKTRMELVRISTAVMGIEFSYAAETAFVSPTLLQIGVEHQHMTLVWALSPLVGFFLCPILGSISDRCKLNMGRRRPFIILLSIGVLLGLLLVPNGEDLGYWLGDVDPYMQIAAFNISANATHKNMDVSPHRTTVSDVSLETTQKTSHPWGIFFTVLGTVLLDFDADACQSPARAYLLDVCIPDDHAKGLSTFTIMAGLGGFMGYAMGGINWDDTTIGRHLGGHVKAVFTIITVLFIACVAYTVTSFREIPLWALNESKPKAKQTKTESDHLDHTKCHYGAIDTNDTQGHESSTDDETIKEATDYPITKKKSKEVCETSFTNTEAANGHEAEAAPATESVHSISHYLLSIVYMPYSVRMLCLTNLFCWMSHVSYSLYFTDFVGEAVYGGDPKAPDGSPEQILYEEGVRFGCWGMAMYSLSCACYSLVIEKLIKRFKAKPVYIGGLIFYGAGMALLALTKAKTSVIIFSWTAGVMYSTLFTMPYLLIAHYHAMGTFETDADGTAKIGSGGVRGLGTDVAIISSMVFLAQFILSIGMGTIVSFSGTTTAVVSAASVLSFCGAVSATQVMYLDL